jgi:hypothetical protein
MHAGSRGGVLSAGRLRHGVVVYLAGERRRRRLGPPVGMAVELRTALLLGDALAGCRISILVSLVVLVRRGLLSLRYHRRRCADERAVSPVRLDCCTGRARLEEWEPLLGGEIRVCRVLGAGVWLWEKNHDRQAPSLASQRVCHSPLNLRTGQ